MVSNSIPKTGAMQAMPPSRQRAILHKLVVVASSTVNSQLDAFAERLSAAWIAQSEAANAATAGAAATATQVGLLYAAGRLLKDNAYPFYHLASAGVRNLLQDEVDRLDSLARQVTLADPEALSLVPFEEMDNRLLVDRTARPLDAAHAPILTTLSLRLGALLGRDQLSAAENPFRPASFVTALDRVWREFDPNEQAHPLMLQQIGTGLCLDLGAIFTALNQVLIEAGVLPGLADTRKLRKATVRRDAVKPTLADPDLLQQLRKLFSSAPTAGGALGTMGAFGTQVNSGRALFEQPAVGSSSGSPSASPSISPALSAYLTNLQARAAVSAQQQAADGAAARRAYRLSDIRQQLPRDAMSRADETTVDVMTRVFDAVFRDPGIAPEMKELIGYLQIPVLRAALLDKEFFFEETHPARRLISVMTKSSLGWDETRGRSDPLYQAIERNVDRMQRFDSEIALFAEVVADMEGFLQEEETRSAAQLATPISKALKQEKIREATRAATSDVAVRLGGGEVVTFVETFLENRWVPVLTLAYSVRDEKPQVLDSALRTMDELIWSVQPKATAQSRRDLVAKLPALITTLNKWLDIVKVDDADRLQFFADLAECHASIVRAPLEISPQRQLELAVEAAKKATERRLARQAAEPPEAPPPDLHAEQVAALERGTWFEFAQPDGVARKLRLTWISPLRSLYIFTTVHREEAFSLGAEQLAQLFRDAQAKVVEVDGFVNQALVETLGQALEQDQRVEPTEA